MAFKDAKHADLGIGRDYFGSPMCLPYCGQDESGKWANCGR